ncbi:hypothetical protein EZV62_000465 [Acer yangbiense]|uniref:F-box domain-containing protein n=1 Tax=Acer yangbiense TaxID=1000413 RepID=A0A5C7IU19_9ROSI|nr:hypothetical protein EZV62_000465 [Acer yangbiense]
MEIEKQRNLHIPDDIIFNILRRLPPKPLARCKCVCKSWESFANQHKYHNYKLLRFSRNTIQSIDFEAADEIKAVDLDIPFKVSSGMLGIASCNGLLCILYKKEGFVIWNPLTGRYKRACLVLNPSADNGFGFWYDHSTHNCKIVRLMRFLDLNVRPFTARYSVEIYSQNSNSWQQKETLPWQIRYIKNESKIRDINFGVLVNEALYWDIRYINNDNEIHAVLRFDTLNEKFDVILSPDNVYIHNIGVFKGHVCLVEYHKVDHIDIWTREVGKNQNWVKFMNLPPFERKSRFEELAPICSMKNDEILASVKEKNYFIGCWMKKEFVLYSPDVKTYKKIHIRSTMKFFKDEITYTDTFVSP